MATGGWEWGGANSWSAGRLEFTSYSNGSAANSSRVDVRLYARRTDGGRSYNYSASNNFWVQCNGSTQYETYQQVSGSGWTLVCAKSFTVGHNADGTKTVNISGGGSIPGSTFNINSYGVNVGLDRIPRYASITSFTNTDVTQISASFKWAADSACDAVQYSLNGGGWVGTSGTTFTIDGLKPNTSYSVKIQVRRKDSQLWTSSGVQNIKTLPIVTLDNGNNLSFNIGSNLLLKFKDYNMNFSYIKFSIQKQGTENQWISNVLSRDIPSGTQQYTLNTSSVATQLYQNCLNSNQVRFRIDITTTIDGNDYGTSYYGAANVVNSNPTFTNYTYKDTNANIQSMLGNSAYMIQQYGNMRATISTANKASPKNYASIVSYSATVTNSSNSILISKTASYSSTSSVTIDFGNFSSVGTYYINISAIDSRGNKSSVVKKTFYVLAYHVPTMSIDIDRANNYEQEIELKLSSQYSKVLLSNSPKNSISYIRYRYRESGTSSWSSYVSISNYSSSSSSTNDTTVTVNRNAANPLITLPSEKSYDFEFVIADKVSEVSNVYTLMQGIPVMIEGDNGVIGVGMIPDWDSSNLLQVGSDIVATDSKGIQKAILSELSKIIMPSSSEPTDQAENYLWLKVE